MFFLSLPQKTCKNLPSKISGCIQWISSNMSSVGLFIQNLFQSIWSPISQIVRFIWAFLFSPDEKIKIVSQLQYKGQEVYIVVVSKNINNEYKGFYSQIVKNTLDTEGTEGKEVILGTWDSHYQDYNLSKDIPLGYGPLGYGISSKSSVLVGSDDSALDPSYGKYFIQNSAIRNQFFGNPDPSDVYYSEAFNSTLNVDTNSSHSVRWLLSYNDEKRFQQTNNGIQIAFTIWSSIGFYIPVLRSAMEFAQDFIMDNMSFYIAFPFNYSLYRVKEIQTFLSFISNGSVLNNKIIRTYAPQSVRNFIAHILEKTGSLGSPFGFTGNGVSEWVSVIELALQKCASTVGYFLPLNYQEFELQLGLMALYAPIPVVLGMTILQISTLFFFTNILLVAVSLAPASLVLAAEYAALSFTIAFSIHTSYKILKFFSNTWIFNIVDNDSVLKETIRNSIDIKNSIDLKKELQNQNIDLKKELQNKKSEYTNSEVTVPFIEAPHFTDRARDRIVEGSVDHLLNISLPAGGESFRKQYIEKGYVLSLCQKAQLGIDYYMCYGFQWITGKSHVTANNPSSSTSSPVSSPINFIISFLKTLKVSTFEAVQSSYQHSQFHGNSQTLKLKQEMSKDSIKTSTSNDATNSNISLTTISEKKRILILSLYPEQAVLVKRNLESAHNKWKADNERSVSSRAAG